MTGRALQRRRYGLFDRSVSAVVTRTVTLSPTLYFDRSTSGRTTTCFPKPSVNSMSAVRSTPSIAITRPHLLGLLGGKPAGHLALIAGPPCRLVALADGCFAALDTDEHAPGE